MGADGLEAGDAVNAEAWESEPLLPMHLDESLLNTSFNAGSSAKQPTPSHKRRDPKGSVFSSVHTLVATMIGGGTLSVPYAFRESGVLVTFGLFCLLGCISAQALFYLLACKKFCEQAKKQMRRTLSFTSLLRVAEEAEAEQLRHSRGSHNSDVLAALAHSSSYKSLGQDADDGLDEGSSSGMADEDEEAILHRQELVGAGDLPDPPTTPTGLDINEAHSTSPSPAPPRSLSRRGSARSLGEAPLPEMTETVLGNEPADNIAVLARVAFGRPAEVFVSVLLLAVLVLTIIAYFILLGDILPAIIQHFDEHSKYASRALTSGCIGLIVLPICLAPSLSSLGFVSFMSLLSTGFLAVAVTIRSVQHMITAGPAQTADQVHLAVPDLSILDSVILISLSFLCHFNILSVREELWGPSRPKIQRIVFSSTALPIFIYGLVGFFGYMRFLDKTKQDILSNFDASDTLLFVAHLTLAMTITCSLPLLIQPCRKTFQVLVIGKSPDTTKWRVCLTPVILGGCFGVAANIDNVVIVWSFAGSTIAITIMFILPPLLFLRLRNLRHGWIGYEWWLVDRKNQQAFAMLCFGVLLLCLCTFQAVAGLKDQTK